MTASGRLCSGDRDVYGLAEFGVFVKFEIAERLLKPFISKPLQLSCDTDGIVQRILADRVTHERIIRTNGFPDSFVDFHVKFDRSARMCLVS